MKLEEDFKEKKKAKSTQIKQSSPQRQRTEDPGEGEACLHAKK